MKKAALIGTGGSATQFLSRNPLDVFDVYTSSGVGELNGTTAKPLSSLKQNDYEEIYILVYALSEVIDTFDFCQLTAKIFWYDSIKDKLYPIKDPHGESITEFELKDNVSGLTILYDFRVEPLTYDFVVFLADADMERRARGLDFINLVFAPGDFGGFNKQWSVEETDEKLFRIHNLIFPATQLLDCPVYIYQAHSRKHARELWESLPNNYPEFHSFLKPVPRHRYSLITNRIKKGETQFVMDHVNPLYTKYVDNWFKSKQLVSDRVVSITLRETFRATLRNSNLTEWFKFADYLNSRNYDVVFVRDTSKVFQPLEYTGKHQVFDTASLNVMIRRAFYRRCFANMYVTNGVPSINIFDDQSRYMMVGVENDAYSECSENELNKLGYDRNKIYGATPCQMINWEKDDFANLVDCFKRLEQQIHTQFDLRK